jgi:predicted phosphodiesterase
VKLLVLSDIHTEFHADGGESFTQSLPEAGVCVLAGDVSNAKGLRATLQRFIEKYAHVVYVHGNHEFYGSDRDSVCAHTKALAKAHRGFHWLDNDSVQINGVKFIGTPLWFRWDALNPLFYENMSDFSQIEGFSHWVYEENAKALGFLQEEVERDSVVITHYLPAPRSVAPQYRGSQLNRFFLCDVEKPLIQARKPKLWIHGHTHTSMDYRIGPTRVLCNPFGYARYEENRQFNPNLIVEV